VFHMVVDQHKLHEVVNECTVRNNIVLAIFVTKIIEVGENLAKLCQKQFWLFFETRCTLYMRWHGESMPAPMVGPTGETVQFDSSSAVHIKRQRLLTITILHLFGASVLPYRQRLKGSLCNNNNLFHGCD